MTQATETSDPYVPARSLPVLRDEASQSRRWSIRDWLGLLRSGWPLLPLFLALGIGGALLYTSSQPTEYGSEATLVVSPARGFLDPQNSDSLPTLTSTVNEIAGTPAVLRQTAVLYARAGRSPGVAAERRRQATLAWLRRHVEPAQEGSSSIIRLRGVADTQTDATDLTRAAVQALEQTVNSGIDRETGGGLRVRAFDTTTRGKVSPTPRRNLLIGIGAGLVLGIVAALLVGALRRRLWRPVEVAAETGLPLLGVAPRRRDGEASLAVVQTAGRLQRLRGGEGPISVLVLGTGPNSGATDVAIDTSRHLKGAVVVEADLQHPEISDRFGLAGEGGLADVLRGDDKELRIRSGAGNAAAAVDVLPAGRPADNGTEAGMNATRLRAILRAVGYVRDYVIVAGPPLERRGDALALAAAVDCCVLVVERGARARKVRQALDAVEATDARFLGTIVTE